MKKRLLYLALIVVLAGVAWWATRKNTGSTIDPGEKEFALQQTKDITRIVLTNKEDVQSVLTLEDGTWMINGQYEARRQAVNTLLTTIRRMRPMYPVSKASHDKVVRDLMSKSVKVELFENKKKRPVKTIHVGGSAINNDGTYMILELDERMAQRPYVVNVPGFSGYLTSRFIADPEEWRSTEVIRYQPDEIQSVEVTYPNRPYNSFAINRDADGTPVFSPDGGKEINQDRVNDYLSLFQSRSIEAFENGYTKIDSVTMQDPFCVLTITSVDGTKKTFEVYYKPVSERTKFKYDANNVPMAFDVDRYFVQFNKGRDFGILQYYVFGPLFRTRKEFVL